MKFNHLDLFSGIGGFSLAAHWAGFETIAHCEILPFGRAVLRKHWPEVPICEDVKQFPDWFIRRFGLCRVDLLTLGFPCQDISGAGKGAGIEGERSGLWFDGLAVIRALRPRFVVAENSPALRTRGIDTVLAGLEEAGYAAEPLVVGAWAAGARHQRDRVFVVAHTARESAGGRVMRWNGGFQFSSPALRFGGDNRGGTTLLQRGQRREDEPGIPRTLDGVPSRVDRLMRIGNAVVPHVVYPILTAIHANLTDATAATRGK